jgi:hypothetical protein
MPAPRPKIAEMRPSTTILPEVGLKIPAIVRSKVVFPDPLWPSSPTLSPSLRLSVTPSSARTVTMLPAARDIRPPVEMATSCLRSDMLLAL